MTIREVQRLLNADLLCGEDLMETEIRSACGSDLMSDVLAFVKEHTVLLTGLTNPHVIRTAELLDVSCIVFSRGKLPTPDMLEMAKERNIAMLATKHTLYVSCGILYQSGLPGGVRS
ncbi:MAG TPA: DRTGG domain-containing protein [Clostridia bacterium]|nr:DRTGG domain-containing protein [Clostridia bacterium]